MAAALELDPEQLGCAPDKGPGAYDRFTGSPLDVHPAAMRAASDLIDRMYESGLLDLLRGLASSGSEIVTKLAEGADTAQTIRAVRNSITLLTILGSIDPGILQQISHPPKEPAVPPDKGANAAERRDVKAPGWLGLLRRFSSSESRRGLALLADALEAVGRAAGRAELKSREKVGA